MNILIAEPLAAGRDRAASMPSRAGTSSFPIRRNTRSTWRTPTRCWCAAPCRSTAAVLEKAPKLRVIGRAGVGVDNVDLDAATAAGVLVMNTPGGNAISVAEHTLALMLAMARHIPQANASTRAGKWEKKKFLGNELRGKTLGIVGLGSIGREVVKRARAFEMRIVAHDPYVTSQIAHDLGVELVDLADALRAERLHHAARGGDAGDAGHAVARGVRADEARRAHRELRARRTGRRGGAGGERSSRGKVAGRGARRVRRRSRRRPASRCSRSDACWRRRTSADPPKRRRRSSACASPSRWWNTCNNGVAINAVNMPAMSPEQYRAMGPYATLAERLGNFAAHIASGNPQPVRLAYFGKIADEQNTTLLRNAGVAGVLARSTSAPREPGERDADRGRSAAGSVGGASRERSVHTDSIRIELETDTGRTTVEGAVVLDRPRLMQVDGIYCEATFDGPSSVHEEPGRAGRDRPRRHGAGQERVNIANFSLGRRDVRRRPGSRWKRSR